MQKPTSEAIREQVSEELGGQLPVQVSDLVVECARRTSSKRKRRATKKKTQSQQGTTPQNSVQTTNMESVEEVSGLTECGEVEEDVQSSSFTTKNSNDQGTSLMQTLDAVSMLVPEINEETEAPEGINKQEEGADDHL